MDFTLIKYCDQNRRWSQVTEVITVYRKPGDPLPSLSCSERVTIQFSDYDATALAKVSLRSTFTGPL